MRPMTIFALSAVGGALGAAAAVLALVAAGVPAQAQNAPPAIPGGVSPAAMTLAQNGAVLYADGQGRLFEIEGSTPRTLGRVYAIRFDRARHANDPGKRAPHGYYLDDLEDAGRLALAEATRGFEREAKSGAVDVEANHRLERWGHAVFDAGDVTYLLEQLKAKAYGTRRAAAFVLGSLGYAEAIPMLEEVATEKSGDGAERAKAVLEALRKR